MCCPRKSILDPCQTIFCFLSFSFGPERQHAVKFDESEEQLGKFVFHQVHSGYIGTSRIWYSFEICGDRVVSFAITNALENPEGVRIW